MSRVRAGIRSGLCLTAFILCALGGVAEEPLVKFVQTSVHRGVGSEVVIAENVQTVDVTVTFELTDSQNMAFDPPLPLTVVLHPHQARPLFTASWGHQGRWSFHYRFSYKLGDMNAHFDRFDYRLPYTSGTTHRVIQGFNGSFSHRGQNAIDFQMSVGTPVVAAREGTVAYVMDQYTQGGVDPSLLQRANEVLILHSDGSLGNYLHIQQGGACVRVGQFVHQGDVIALSGNVGYTSTPHLHFAVTHPIDGHTRAWDAVRFVVAGSAEPVTLRQGESYTAR